MLSLMPLGGRCAEIFRWMKVGIGDAFVSSNAVMREHAPPGAGALGGGCEQEGTSIGVEDARGGTGDRRRETGDGRREAG